MATDTGRTTVEGFGEVNRIKGTLFEYATLAASVVGIVALGVLLAYVFWDAFGLGTAGVRWYGAFAALVVAPVVGFVWYARRNSAVGAVALELVSTATAGLLAGFGAVAVLEIIAGDPVWFTYFATVVGPLLALFWYDRRNAAANWVGFGYLAVLVGGPVAGTALLSPLTAVAELVGAPLVYYLSLVVPTAAVTRTVVEDRLELGNGTYAAAAVLLGAVAAVPLVDAVPLLSRSVWLIFLTTLVVPTAVVVGKNLAVPERRPGFVGPAAFVAGVAALSIVSDIAGLQGPDTWFDWQFVTEAPSQTATQAGLYPAIIGSVFIIVLVAIITLLLAIGAAVYLEEYAPSSGLRGAIARFIRINISNLAGVPSVVYGLLGLAVFANALQLGVGTVITAAFTLSLLILPIVIISAREAINSVPDSLRQAAYGMGATRWQVVRTVVIPRSLPGTLTGTILALGRAIGETAPLIMIGVATTAYSPPLGLFGRTSAMPMQVYVWASYPSQEFQHGVVAAGVVTLLVVLLTMNSIAILLRNKFEEESF
ncbi:MAG: phosphate ABC transporter permease PstA [Halolamina sp.]